MSRRRDILVSACLLGEPVRYDATANESEHPILEQWRRGGRLLPFCPEVAGDLGTPRPPAEIVGGSGTDVLRGEARVETESGSDVTDSFVAGARRTLEIARANGVRVAILKSRSPSCGSTGIYDGSFSDQLRAGSGVTTALLERHEIPVFDEQRLDAARRHLERSTS